MSPETACSHAESEIKNFDFESTRKTAVQQWTEKMRPIRVSRNGVKSDVLTNFYSGIYRTMVNPQNYTGENPLWQSTEPYFDSFYWYVEEASKGCMVANFYQSLGLISLPNPISYHL